MRILIIEDEKPAARLLERKVAQLGFAVETQLHSVAEALEWFSKNREPDLIFLDIQLSDGLSFEIFDQFKIKSAIIFTTAYDEYALRAFKLNSIDYLLKPINNSELKFALDQFTAHRDAFFGFSENLNLFKNFIQNDSKPAYKERFAVKIGQQIKIVPLAHIACFYSKNKATYLRTVEGRDYLVDQALDLLEPSLDSKLFFRINRKYIIALADIQEIQVFSNSRLNIKLRHLAADDLIVSREKVAAFKSWID